MTALRNLTSDSDSNFKREVRIETGMRFGKATPLPAELKAAARNVLDAKAKQKGLLLDSAATDSLINSICDDMLGFGPLEALLRDQSITEIMVNGPDQIYIETNGRKTLSETRFDDEGHLRTILDKMLGLAGRRLDESSPFVDFSLNDGSRINAIISPLAVDGSSVTIRKFLATLKSLDDLVQLKTINEPMSRFL
jgi:pilus assembly protein CpaF